MQSYGMLIDGRVVNTAEQDPVINPAFGEPFATCARGTKAHINEAVDSAANAFKTWRKDEAFRRQKLNECAAALQAKVNDIAPVLSFRGVIGLSSGVGPFVSGAGCDPRRPRS